MKTLRALAILATATFLVACDQNAPADATPPAEAPPPEPPPVEAPPPEPAPAPAP